MNWQRQSKKLLACCAIIIAGAVIGGLTYLDIAAANEPQAAGNGRTGQVWNVPTIEEASSIAQYTVGTLEFLPQGFVSVGNIAVIRHRVPGDVVTVIQTWRNIAEKSAEISLVQNPELDGIGGGEPAEIRGITGQRVLSPAFENRPELLSLYWQEGDMSYVLTGTVNSQIDEATLKKALPPSSSTRTIPAVCRIRRVNDTVSTGEHCATLLESCNRISGGGSVP